MGNAQSYVPTSSQSVLTALVVAGVVGFGVIYNASSSTSLSSTVGNAQKGVNASKKKKQKPRTSKAAEPSSSHPVALTHSNVDVANSNTDDVTIPGEFLPEICSNSVNPTPPPSLASVQEGRGTKKSKGKKKKAAGTGGVTHGGSSTPAIQVNPSPPGTSSGNVSDSSAGAAPTPTPKPKAKRQQRKQDSASQSSSQPSRQSTTSLVDFNTDSSWTHVGPKSKKWPLVDTEIAASMTTQGHTSSSIDGRGADSSSPVTERTTDEGNDEEEEESGVFPRPAGFDKPTNRRTAAERLLPRPRKTGVDDMLETPDYPVLSRVVRVQPKPGEKPAAGFSWGDYEDVDATGGEGGTGGDDVEGEDDGWGVVKSRGRPRTSHSSYSTQTTQQKAPETLTKKQRQNANKREAQKTAKAEAEKERQQTLAKHKRELEKARIAEQYKGGSGKKVASGGMVASVDDKGKLVWE